MTVTLWEKPEPLKQSLSASSRLVAWANRVSGRSLAVAALRDGAFTGLFDEPTWTPDAAAIVTLVALLSAAVEGINGLATGDIAIALLQVPVGWVVYAAVVRLLVQWLGGRNQRRAECGRGAYAALYPYLALCGFSSLPFAVTLLGLYPPLHAPSFVAAYAGMTILLKHGLSDGLGMAHFRAWMVAVSSLPAYMAAQFVLGFTAGTIYRWL